MRTTESEVLLKTEKSLVEVDKDTLAVAVKSEGQLRGFVFQGKGRLVLDTIVETDEGAIGEPIERELDKPFLVLGDVAKSDRSLTVAAKEDLEKAGYADQKQFLEKAGSVLDMFGGRGKIHDCGHSGEGGNSVFAFQNETGKLDLLVVSRSRLVYKASDVIFVADGDKTILKNPRHIALSKPHRYITHCT
jgi:hypothetical protein